MNCCDSASHPWDRWHVEQRWMPHPLRTPHCRTRGHRRSRLSVPAGGTCFFAFLPAASAKCPFRSTRSIEMASDGTRLSSMRDRSSVYFRQASLGHTRNLTCRPWIPRGPL
jgi:hypothetical protein